jgi:hypothetical protein
MDLDALRNRGDILGRVEWDLTPQRALELLSLKSRGMAPRSRVRHSREKHYYFCVDNWRERPRLLLKERSIHNSRSIAEVEAPLELLADCVSAHGEGKAVYPLSDSLPDWLRKALLY